MSFTTEIYAVMIADSSLNGMVDGGIHHENMIDEWLADDTYNEWVVYDFHKQAQEDCITSKNVYMTYALSIMVIQRNTNTKIDVITGRLLQYLNNHGSGNIIDIGFKNDLAGLDQIKNVYTNTLEFECVYIET